MAYEITYIMPGKSKSRSVELAFVPTGFGFNVKKAKVDHPILKSSR